jgi:hypothetical protein
MLGCWQKSEMLVLFKWVFVNMEFSETSPAALAFCAGCLGYTL